MSEEIAPLLPAVPGIDLPDYQRSLLDRFSNSEIRDPLDRLCRRGSTKMPAYFLPSVCEASQHGRPRELLAIGVAGWIRYLRGSDLSGTPLTIVDARREELQPLAVRGGADPRPLLARRDIFGDVIDDHVFVGAVERSLAALEQGGVDALVANGRLTATADAA
jgi:mannitol-1-phosphate/altronate dehydrogenase